MRLFIFMAVLLPVILGAQTAPPVPLPGAGSGGAAPNKPNLLFMAYDNMLAGRYASAEEQYQSLAEMEPDNLAAHEGYLWALNAQEKFSHSLAVSQRLLKRYPGNVQFYNYHAYPLLEQKRLPEARYYYLSAYRQQPNNLKANEISQEGLAYTYKALGDYHRHNRHLQANAAITGIPAAKPKVGLFANAAYAVPGEAKHLVSVSAGLNYKQWSASVAYEDFSIDGASYRSISSAKLGMQLLPFDIELSSGMMDGEDERAYPAQLYSARLTPKLYLGKLIVYPALMAHYGHYPRFDIQQLSILPEVLWRDFRFNYSAHYSYMDNLTVNADSSRFAQQVKLTRNMPWNTTLGLHYGDGDYRWMIDGGGVVMDTFNRQGAYYGVSLLVPFLKRFSVFLYHNRQEEGQLWFASLTARY